MKILLDAKLVYQNGTAIELHGCYVGYIPGSPTVMQLSSPLNTLMASVPMDGSVLVLFDNARGTTSQVTDDGTLPKLVDGAGDPINSAMLEDDDAE